MCVQANRVMAKKNTIYSSKLYKAYYLHLNTMCSIIFVNVYKYILKQVIHITKSHRSNLEIFSGNF